VGARLARQLEVGLSRVDLSLSQYRTLVFLEEGGSSAASALADSLAVSRPSVTAVVDGLVGRGLVERRHDDSDRRRVEHRLTERGREVLAEADAAVEARLREIVGCLLDEHQAVDAFAGLDLWRRGLDADRAARKAAK
jgi:long-chain acyl-CoA synthetase